MKHFLKENLETLFFFLNQIDNDHVFISLPEYNRDTYYYYTSYVYVFKYAIGNNSYTIGADPTYYRRSHMIVLCN